MDTAAADRWRPAAGVETLRRRASLLAQIRAFFVERAVLEVDTPLLGSAPSSDPQQQCLDVAVPGSGRRYLQPSPEFAMKRLLAAGSGSIYQICKAFRAGEHGTRHRTEFTLVEWYRVGFDYRALMDEVQSLVCGLLQRPPARAILVHFLITHRCPPVPGSPGCRARAAALC